MSGYYENPSLKEFKEFIEALKRNLKKSSFLVLILVGIVTVWNSYYTVEPDEEAVIIRLGKYLNTELPGLHFKVPFVDKVIKIKTKRVHQFEFGYRTSNVNRRNSSYSSSNYDNESLMLTGDLNVADVEWVVQFQISDPFKFIFKTSEPEQNIRDIAESIMRRVVGDMFVTEVLTTGRTEVADTAKTLMQEIIDRYDMGVRIVSVKLQDVNPPSQVKASFNEVNEAKQEQEKLINNAEKKYNEIIPAARGKANKMISEAKGKAIGFINRAEGDADKFKSIYREYVKAPAITKKRIYLETMETVMSELENITIVDSKIKGVLPLYNSLSGKGQ